MRQLNLGLIGFGYIGKLIQSLQRYPLVHQPTSGDSQPG